MPFACSPTVDMPREGSRSTMPSPSREPTGSEKGIAANMIANPKLATFRSQAESSDNPSAKASASAARVEGDFAVTRVNVTVFKDVGRQDPLGTLGADGDRAVLPIGGNAERRVR